MKPLKLHLENFGPYEDEKIDFTNFFETPLFLISGDTGSGKTTIFDGMCYALFGETSNQDRKGTEMISLNSDGASTKVTFVFEHQGREYTVQRSPQYLRKGNKTPTSSKAVFTYKLDDGSDSKSPQSKLVTNKVKELLGMNVKQFTQIMMLPQGQFTEFLRSDSKTKEEILRKLFGTDIYNQWEEKIFNKLKALKKIEEEQNVKIRNLISSVELSKDIDEGHIDEWLQQAYEDTQGIDKQIKTSSDLLTINSQKRDVLLQKQKETEELQRLFDNKRQLVQRQAELNNQKKEYQSQKQSIKKISWVQLNQSDYLNLDKTRQELKVNSEQEEKYQAELSILIKEKNDKHFQLEKLTSQKEKYTDLHSELTLLRPKVKFFEKRDNDKKILAEISTRKKASQDIIDNKSQELKVISANLTNLKELIKKDTDIPQQIQLQQELLIKQSDYNSKLQNLSAEFDKIKGFEKEITNHSKVLDRLNAKVAIQKSEYDELRDKYGRGQIARITKDYLKDDIPCPVCGSLEHPNPFKLSDIEIVSDSDLQKQEIKYSKAKNNADKQQGKLDILKRNLTEQKQQFKNLYYELFGNNEKFDSIMGMGAFVSEQQSISKKQIIEIKELISNLGEKNKKLKFNQQTMLDLQEKFESLNTNIVALEKDNSKLNDEYIRQSMIVKTDEDQLQNIACETKQQFEDLLNKKELQIEQYETQVNDLTKQVNDLESKKAQLAGRLKNIQDTLKQLSENKIEYGDKFNKLLATAPFELNTENDFINLLSQIENLDKLRNLVQKYELDAKTTNEKINQIDKQIDNRQIADIDQLNESISMLSKSIVTLNEKITSSKVKKEKIISAVNGINQTIKEQRNKADEYRQLNTLYEVVSGKTTGEDRLGFERYVLRLYLKTVLDVANKRFKYLSDGRYTMSLSSKLSKSGKNSGLELNVRDEYLGRERSIHSLSGGESFMAALALSLALGEVVQRQSGGIQVEALFIDEGFGSLDENSLDKALETLQNIQSNNRIIGIISHVRELKDKLSQQILVKKDASGRSHVFYKHE